ncbi:MAG: sterol desaturase family protein [Melioribacteraceae bacterium]|nr:sterol desaturase family protein [Melioribacteraceae bacterium]
MSITEIRYISFLIIAIAALIIFFLERLFPYTPNQKILRQGFWNDIIFYNFLQTFLLGIIISYIIEFIDNSTGVSRLKILEGIPVWVQLVIFTVSHDLYIYFFHKWQHKNKFLWRLHEAHHSTKEVDWLSGVRSHALEILINQTVEFLPIVLLGASPEVAVYKGVISAVWGMYIHSNIDVKSGRLQLLINGPEMHRWHHSIGKGRNRNFATKLAVWDWVFHTDYLPENKPDQYGLKTDFPNDYFSQLIYAFRSFKRK